MADFVYRYGEATFRQGAWDWENSGMAAMLLAPAYTPNQDADQFVADISTHEVSGQPRELVGSRSVLESGAGTVQLIGAELFWASESDDVRWAVIFNDRANDLTSELFLLIDFTTTRSPGGQSVTVTPSGGSPGVWAQVDL